MLHLRLQQCPSIWIPTTLLLRIFVSPVSTIFCSIAMDKMAIEQLFYFESLPSFPPLQCSTLKLLCRCFIGAEFTVQFHRIFSSCSVGPWLLRGTNYISKIFFVLERKMKENLKWLSSWQPF